MTKAAKDGLLEKDDIKFLVQPLEAICVQDSNNESDYVLFFGPPRVAFESGITPGMHLIQNNR